MGTILPPNEAIRAEFVKSRKAYVWVPPTWALMSNGRSRKDEMINAKG